MKIKLALTVVAVLISGHVSAKTWVLTSAESGVEKGNWRISSDELNAKGPNFSIEQKFSTAVSRKAVKSLLLAVKMASQ